MSCTLLKTRRWNLCRDLPKRALQAPQPQESRRHEPPGLASPDGTGEVLEVGLEEFEGTVQCPLVEGEIAQL
ncbi:MAG: hypothetical protein VB878_05960, partial [Pirellulaceae bacterium]